MASERRRDDVGRDLVPVELPFPLPPGWVFHPRSPNASVEDLRKHLGVCYHDGPIVLGDMLDDDDASVSDEEWQSWQEDEDEDNGGVSEEVWLNWQREKPDAG